MGIQEYQESLEYTKDYYPAVANMYPDKAVVITEAGWATKFKWKRYRTT